MTTVDQADYYSEGSCSSSIFDESNSQSYIKRAGPFVLGPKLGNSPVKCISHYLARKEGTNNYSTLKILTKKQPSETETIDDQQGKVLIHTEYSLLTALKGEPGVIQQNGLFKDLSMEEMESKNGELVRTGRMETRLCLVLDCYTPHDFCPEYIQLTNLQYYVIKEKRLSEYEAIDIFYKTVQIVERLHKRNIVHRDLKLGNIILNRETREVKITNFCLGKQLASETDYLKDQRGSPAYISPDVISGKPYLGKPSDMWALGVVLYTMLCGQFPFYDKSPTELFKKIKSAEFHIPIEHNISQSTVELIQSLLVLNPSERLTASQALLKLRRIMSGVQAMKPIEFTQVVPDCAALRPSHSRKRTYDMIESVPLVFPSAAAVATPPPAVEPKTAKEEPGEDEIDYLPPEFSQQEFIESNDQQQKQQEESKQVTEPPKKMRRTVQISVDLLKHLKTAIGDSKLRSIIEQYAAVTSSSGKLERPTSPAARHGGVGSQVMMARKRRSVAKVMRSGLSSRVPSPSVVEDVSDYSSVVSPESVSDACDLMDEEMELNGAKSTAAAPPSAFARNYLSSTSAN